MIIIVQCFCLMTETGHECLNQAYFAQNTPKVSSYLNTILLTYSLFKSSKVQI